MRSFLVGLLLLALTSVSFGQVTGEVESIGFGGGWYRPQCWTPMVIRLRSQISDPAEYRIEVHQHDLDFDHVIYVKDGITLNGQATQRWELCFLPEPIHGGLPEMSARDLQDRLRVYLTNKEGTRQLLQLPITSPVQSLEAQAAMMGFGMGKASKLVLLVNDGSSHPQLSEGSYDKAIGLVERPQPVTVRPGALPQSALAYQAVDAVVWLSGDAHALSEEGSKQLTALQDWVRQGGTLIVCQPSIDAERARIEPFADMLPIQWKVDGEWKVGVHEKNDLQPLRGLAVAKNPSTDWERFWNLKGPFAFAKAVAKPNAIVETDDWIEWDKSGKDRSPYIARGPYGLGCVTWVAQNLGDSAITGGTNTIGWQYVWDHVFGWKNEDRLPNDRIPTDETNYTGDIYSDMGSTMNKGVEFGAKGTGLIALAIIFFVIYWIVAGPGSYLFLAGKKRKEMSWAAFGAAALVATLLTVLVVRLVLRGSPEIHHATDVRIVQGSQEPQPAIAISKIGLYIPRDGNQTLSLPDTSNQFVSDISPLAVVPSNIENDYPANLDYQIPVPDTAGTGGAGIDVPFRSTLKKLQATWAGDSSKVIRGNNVQLLLEGALPSKTLKGTLDNLTGVDLKNVYIAFHDPSAPAHNGEDYVIFFPSWPGSGPEVHQDLTELLGALQLPPHGNMIEGMQFATPGNDTRCWGDIAQRWSFYWFKNRSIEPGGMGQSRMVDDLNDPIPASFPMLSLFNRLPPVKKSKDPDIEPFTILRRGARNIDMSAAIAAGEMVVLAQADNQPLPFTFDVNGNKVGGTGTVFYQFALPLERVAPPPPPAPTTKP
jgi:hypothetical protein